MNAARLSAAMLVLLAHAASGQQIAIRVPVPQRRKHQILADNKHTPPRMLIDSRTVGPACRATSSSG